MRSLFLILFAALACAPEPTENHADAKGFGTFLDEGVVVPKFKSKPELARIRVGIVRSTEPFISQGLARSLRNDLQIILLREVGEAGGVPRTQIKEILSDLLEDGSLACNGSPCSRLLGITADQIDPFLDETAEAVRKSKTMGGAGRAGTEMRRILLGSLKKSSEEQVPSLWQRSRRIVYNVVNEVSRSGVTLSDPAGYVALKVRPGDLASATNFQCKNDVCEASFLKPFKVSLRTPVSFGSLVTISYQRAKSAATAMISHTAKIKGTMVPVNLGKILSVRLEFSGQISRMQHAPTGPVVANVRCNAALSCDLPMFSVSATVGPNGLSLSPSLNLGAQFGRFVRVGKTISPGTQNVSITSLPPAVQDIRRQIQEMNPPPPAVEPDVFWVDFADELRGT